MANARDYDDILGFHDWQRYAYEQLAIAIIETTVDDYVKYLMCESNHTKDIFHGRLIPIHKNNQYEKFFKGTWFSTLTTVDPDYMIEMSREKAFDKYAECHSNWEVMK